MYKSALTAAVAAVVALASFATPAAAADSHVMIYGRLQENVETIHVSGSANGSAVTLNRLSSDGSEFGFRGTENLGNGLSAIWKIEQNLILDTGNPPALGLASRNTYVGLQGKWGTMLGGLHDTPYKSVTVILDPFFEAPPASEINIFGGNTATTAANVAARQAFNRREKNSILYKSPNFSGVQLSALYGFGEEKDPGGATVPPVCTVACNPSLWSTAATYKNGPLYLAAAVEGHEQYANTATERTQDRGYKVGGYYQLGHHRIALQYESLRWHGNIGKIGLKKLYTVPTSGDVPDDVRLDSWGVTYIGTTFAPWIIRAAVLQNLPLRVGGQTVSATRATNLVASLVYQFSKRTELWLMYMRLNNQANSGYDIAVNATGLTYGQSVGLVGLGMRHFF